MWVQAIAIGGALGDAGQDRPASGAAGFVCEAVVFDLCAVCVGFDCGQPLRGVDQGSGLVVAHGVGAVLVEELHPALRRRPGVGVAGIVDAVDPVGLGGRIAQVVHGHVVADRVGDLVERPEAHLRLALEGNARVRRKAVLHHLARLGPDLEALRPGTGAAQRDDLGEAVDFGAILGAVGAIRAGDRDQPLPIQAKAVVRVEVHPADRAVLRDGPMAAVDDGEAAERPADAEDAVAAAAVVDQRQAGLHPGNPGRHRQRQAVGRRSALVDRQRPRRDPSHRLLRQRPSRRQRHRCKGQGDRRQAPAPRPA